MHIRFNNRELEAKSIFKSDYWNVYYFPSIRCMFVKWHEPSRKMNALEHLYKDHLLSLAAKVEEHHPVSIFVDATEKMYIANQGTRTWHDTVIVPKFHHGGVRKMAFLESDNIFVNSTTIKTFEEQTAKNLLEVAFFNDRDSAEKWVTK